ncbi:hypothetical protein QZH41_018689, partial [Actinostola sp. cb2023]
WNLICDRTHLKAMTQAVYMAGLLVGSIGFGVMSDKFGRRISIFLSIFLLAACGVASALADCLSLFALFRFAAGAACGGCLVARYVYCVELVATKHRTAAGFICNIFVSFGFDLLALMAYLIRDWRHLMLAVSLPAAPLLICWWFVNALVYFGISLNVKNLGGDMYLNFFILSIVELPGVTICWLLLARFGRRIPYSALMLTEYRYAILTLAMIGKSCIMSTFLAIYIYTAELYPTVIRNIAVGASSMMARFGGIAAPFVVLLADLPNVSKTLPLVIFGTMGVAAGIMALWLPETLYIPMAQTVEQAEMCPEDYNILCRKGAREAAQRKYRKYGDVYPSREEVTFDERL